MMTEGKRDEQSRQKKEKEKSQLHTYRCSDVHDEFCTHCISQNLTWTIQYPFFCYCVWPHSGQWSSLHFFTISKALFSSIFSLFVFPLESFHHSHSASLPEVTEGKHGAVDSSVNITSGFSVYFQAELQPGISPQSRFAVCSTQSVFTFLRCWRAFCAPEFRFAAAVSAGLAFRSERRRWIAGRNAQILFCLCTY